MIIDRIHSSLLPKALRDRFLVLSIICHALSGFPDISLSGDHAFFRE
jgi:hypothetical protein